MEGMILKIAIPKNDKIDKISIFLKSDNIIIIMSTEIPRTVNNSMPILGNEQKNYNKNYLTENLCILKYLKIFFLKI